MKAKRVPKWLYIAEYKCGCSADSYVKRDLLNYCSVHGDDRIRIYKLPNKTDKVVELKLLMVTKE